MNTHRQLLKGNCIHGADNYIGEYIPDEYKVLLATSRDADCLTRSNWNTAIHLLGGENVRIDRFGSWACGWFEYLSVKENTPQYEIAEKIESDLKSYPVLDESDFSELEDAEADEIWKTCYNESERLQYIKENRYMFDFCSISHAKETIRGEYFSGCASELIG